MVKEFLSQRGIAYTERDIDVDRSAAGEVTRLTGQMAVPVTVIDGQVVVGFDRPRLEQVLAAAAHRPSLGAAVRDAVDVAGSPGMPSPGGAYVGSIKPGSLAQRIGLAASDIIIEVNGQSISKVADLERVVLACRTGSQVSVSFLRGGNRLSGSGVL
jgi:S1-C subfamily serine protease